MVFEELEVCTRGSWGWLCDFAAGVGTRYDTLGTHVFDGTSLSGPCFCFCFFVLFSGLRLSLSGDGGHDDWKLMAIRGCQWVEGRMAMVS
jgi:hypothetical protein